MGILNDISSIKNTCQQSEFCLFQGWNANLGGLTDKMVGQSLHLAKAISVKASLHSLSIQGVKCILPVKSKWLWLNINPYSALLGLKLIDEVGVKKTVFKQWS